MIKLLSKKQISQLSKMQDHLNQLACMVNFGHTDWRSMNFDWGLAIVDEVMEIHGHLGWKWWKGSQKYNVGLTLENKKQVQLEVIDILHFGLSKWMQFGKSSATMGENLGYDLDGCLTFLIASNSKSNYFFWPVLFRICELVDLDASEIMDIYTGKYALNIFRQEHGYGEGTYQKQWLIPEVSIKYEEDNWYLEKIIETLDQEGQEVSVKTVTLWLEHWYRRATGGGK